MTVRYAGALDAAGTFIQNGSLAEAKWDDICELLLELGYTVEPKIWYYSLGDHAGVIGLDLEQRKRTTTGRHLFCEVRPGTSRSVELDQVKTKLSSPLQDAYLADLLAALQSPGHGLVGAVVQAKKFPSAPEVGAFYCPPVEHMARFDNGTMLRFGNVFWRAGTGTAVTGPDGKSTFVPDPEDDPAARLGLGYWLDKQRFATALKHWVKGTSAEKPRTTRERTIEYTGTCGICLGNFKMNRRGDLVLHGYKRPGYGWIEGNCAGTGYPPYEISDAACKAFATRLENTLAHVNAQLADFKQALATGTLESLPDSRNGRLGNRQHHPSVKPGEPRWEIELRNYPKALEERVKGLTSLITENQKMLKLWAPRPLPGEPGHKSIGTVMMDARREHDAAVLSSELEGDTFFPFTPCSSCDPIYNQLQQQVKESGIFDIPSFSASAYRVGPLNPNLRGLFFSADTAGARAYGVFHEGHEVKKYSINIGRTIVAGHQSRLIELFFKKSMHDLQYEYSQKVKGDSNWWAKVDAKIMREAKRRGYDAIIYTRPAAPASIEVVVFSTRGVHEINEDGPESTGTATAGMRKTSSQEPSDAERFIAEIRAQGKPMGKRLSSAIYLFGGASSVELVPSGPREVYLQRIRTFEAGGKGSATLKLLTTTADKLGVDLVLVVNPFDTKSLDADALTAWYSRYGFEPDNDAEESGTMNRHPRATTARTLSLGATAPSTDIYVTSVELVPGLEPSSADDIATAVYCSFTVAGPALARALGAQLRTLSRRVDKMTPEQALSAVKRSPAVLDILEAAAKRAVRIYVALELMEHSPRSSDLEVDLSEATDWTPLTRFAKSLDGTPQLVVQELELNVVLL